jgi:hypothetical protein
VNILLEVVVEARLTMVFLVRMAWGEAITEEVEVVVLVTAMQMPRGLTYLEILE